MVEKIKPSRTVFKGEIITEFLPARPQHAGGAPTKASKKVIILCPGVPGVPHRDEVMNLLSKKGFWVFHPRYRGTWESKGKFLKKSPHQDILDIIDQLPRGFKDSETGKTIRLKSDEIYLIGGSFGGPAAILASKDSRIKKVVSISGVTDWRRNLRTVEPLDQMKKYVKEYFGRAYDFDNKDWDKLEKGKFYNPIAEAKNLDSRKIFMIHCQDDDIVLWQPAEKFAKITGAKLWLLKKGGHLGLSVLLDPKISKKVFDFLEG